MTAIVDGWADATNARHGYDMAPGEHERDVAAFLAWLARMPGATLVSVDEVRMRLGKTPRSG